MSAMKSPVQSDAEAEKLEQLLAVLQHRGILREVKSVASVKEEDLRLYAKACNVPIRKPNAKRPMNFSEMLYQLHRQLCGAQSSRDRGFVNYPWPSERSTRPVFTDTMKLARNYCGLPSYAYPKSALSIAYASRAADSASVLEEFNPLHLPSTSSSVDDSMDSARLSAAEMAAMADDADTVIAQQKCAAAFLSMASNELIATQFVQHNGISVVIKLALQSNDTQVLADCAQSFAILAKAPEFAVQLQQAQVFAVLANLMERGNSDSMRWCSVALARLTSHDELVEPLLRDGLLLSISSTIHLAHDNTAGNLLVALSNVAVNVVGAHAELLVRLFIQASRRIDYLSDEAAGYFMSSMIHNLSLLKHYRVLMVEEGIIGIIKEMVNNFSAVPIIEKCARTLSNLSVTRKTRKDIISSGVAVHLAKLAVLGDQDVRFACVVLLANLLVSAEANMIFTTYHNVLILKDMIQRDCERNCVLATFCLTLISNEESAVETIMDCECVEAVLEAQSRWSGESRLTDYICRMVTNMAAFPALYARLLRLPGVNEVMLEYDFEGADLERITATAKYLKGIAYCCCKSEGALQAFNSMLEQIVAAAMKLLEVNDPVVQDLVLQIFTDLAISSEDACMLLINADVVGLLRAAVRIESQTTREACAQLMYFLSTRESICSALVDTGVLMYLMSLSETPDENIKNMCSAAFFNLSAKRALVGSGLFGCLMQLMDNTKGVRVLWCTECIANMSTYRRSRQALSRETLKLLTNFNALMRYGVDDADKAQYFCGVAICNVLSEKIDEAILHELIKSNAVENLIVISLLRVNSLSTKEALARALFNLLICDAARKQMVEVGIVEALMQLSKMDSVMIKSLTIRAVYNLSCQGTTYLPTLLRLDVPAYLVSYIVTSAPISNDDKYLCGQALTNMARHRDCATVIVQEKIAETMYGVSLLNTEQSATCCVVGTLYLSRTQHCVALNNSVILPLVVSLANKGSATLKHAVAATVCNFTTYPAMHEYVSNSAMKFLATTIGTPQLPTETRLDALLAVYQLVRNFEPAKMKAVEHKVVSSIAKLHRVIDQEEHVVLVAKTLRAITTNRDVHLGAVADGVLPLVGKIVKLEIAEVKVNLADVAYALTSTQEDQYGGITCQGIVDILFWLTLQDCLGATKSIFTRCARVLHNLAIHEDIAQSIVAQDRLAPVLRALIASTDIETKFQVTSSLYSMIAYKRCQGPLLRVGVVEMLLELATSDDQRILHLASAALHKISNDIPNPGRPEVIAVLISLLEVNQQTLLDASKMVSDSLPIPDNYVPRESTYDYTGSDSVASWSEYIVEYQCGFSPPQITFEQTPPLPNPPTREGDLAGIDGTHSKFTDADVQLEGGDDVTLEAPASARSSTTSVHQSSARERSETQASNASQNNNNSTAILGAARSGGSGGGGGLGAAAAAVAAGSPAAHHADRRDLSGTAMRHTITSTGLSSIPSVPAFPPINRALKVQPTMYDSLGMIKKSPYRASSERQASRVQESFGSRPRVTFGVADTRATGVQSFL